MANYFLYGSIALVAIVLIIGFLAGLRKGVKRASTHVLFAVASVIIAFFITPLITNLLMNINIAQSSDGTTFTLKEYILYFISNNLIDLSNFDSLSSFIQELPGAVLNPIVFIFILLLVYFILGIIYVIVARISFGSKRKDFKQHKPHRLYGAFIGMIEAFLFMIVLFAPITSLTNTYAELVTTSVTTTATDDENGYLLTIGDYASQTIPSTVNEIVLAYNNSAIGKICSLGGFDDAMFDGLSSFEIDGEKIYIREEIVSIANAYNSFVVVYNNISDGNYNIDISDFKAAVKYVVQNGLFKTVITNTIKDIIVNIDDITFSGQPLREVLPDVAQEFIDILQEKFSSEDFDAYAYLSSDINTILDIVEELFNGVIENLFDAKIADILAYVVDNNNTFASILQSVTDLNLVTDGLPVVVQLVNDQLLAGMFANDEDVVVALNENATIDDFKETISKLLEGDESVVIRLNALNEEYNILSIDFSENLLEEILNIENIEDALVDLGGILDDINAMPIFSYELDNKQVSVVENILITFGVDVLGDEVYDEDSQGNITLSTYEAFFEYLKTPISTVVDSGLADVIFSAEISFDDIMDILITGICGNEPNYNYLADILMPIYELDKATIQGQTLRELIFKTIVDLIDENLNQYITLPELDAGYETWKEALVSVAELVESLSGEYDEDVTYLDYMLNSVSGSEDYLTLVSVMNDNDDLEKLLNVLFGNDMFNNLNKQIFNILDEKIGELTGVTINTDFEDVYTNDELREKYVSEICALIDEIADIDTEEFADILTTAGAILDILKENAQTTNGGVFKEIFNSIIWYLTGEVAEDNVIQVSGNTEFEYATQVKEFLNADTADDGYFGIAYETTMASLIDVLKFGVELANNIGNVSFDEGDLIGFISALETTVDNLEFEDIATVIETASSITSLLDDEGLSEVLSKIETYEDSIKTAIGQSELNDDIKEAFIKFFFGDSSVEA